MPRVSVSQLGTAARIAMTRRRFLHFIASFGAATTAGVLVDATAFEPREPVVNQVTVPLRRLPKGLDGFTIAHLSDLHYHPLFTAKPITDAVRLVNRLLPDLVVLTGDYVTVPLFGSRRLSESLSRSQVEPCAHLLRALQPKLGTFAVMGNHDQRAHPDLISSCLAAEKIWVLRNQSLPIYKSGSRLWLAGVDDVLTGHAKLEQALHKIPSSETTVLLAHEPDFADHASRFPVDLQLSGHSHGGQVRLPLLGAPYLPELGRKYPWGLRHLGNMALYTNVGLGSIRLPIRWNCAPEVTLLKLRCLSS